MIEEAYEAVDAIEGSSRRHLAEELGDVLMQVVLQSQIGSDEGEFTVDDVIRGISEKLVRRHPHVFGGHACGFKSCHSYHRMTLRRRSRAVPAALASTARTSRTC
jgi:uncharacterized protein YabN with tetrapyrrole methylase and pyrophosphatase domain